MRFWVDARTRIVMRLKYEMTVEFPQHGPRTTEHTLAITHLAVDQPVDASTFEFAPPAGATEMSAGRGFSVGSAGSWVGSIGGPGKPGVSHQSSHNWDGGTFVERSQWTFRGHEFTFERRWTLSDGETEVRIDERIQGPKGPVERTVSLPVA